METRLSLRQMENLKKKLRFNSCFVMDNEGKGGRLVLLWKHDIDISILSFFKYHIDLVLKVEGKKK